MKKILLFASALTGFAFVAQAEEATTIKTTTVQYSVPTCTNCRTTTEVRTVYPEPEPVCTTCGTPVAEPVVMVKDTQKEVAVPCASNHELGIRNPLFVLKEGQTMGYLIGSLFKNPKGRTPLKDDVVTPGEPKFENRGSIISARLNYGLTDRWTVSAWGAKGYATPKKKSVSEDRWRDEGWHESDYEAHLLTEYQLLDACHFDLFAGLEGYWHQTRQEYRNGAKDVRLNGYGWGPTVKAGFPVGWFTPYIQASYLWSQQQRPKLESGATEAKKSWRHSNGYYVNPGLYFQPSKWVGFDLNYQKWEKATSKPQWNARVDFYPYKNVSVSLQASAREPTKHPMQMYEGTLDFAIVF